MNRIHRTVWNPHRQCTVVVSETARTRGKPSRVSLAVAAAFGSWLLGTSALAQTAPPPARDALPQGASVVGGQAQVSQNGAAMTVTQTSTRAAINWQSFDIGAQASVQFVQPSASSVALNRVVGGDVSRIWGTLSANGQVFLVNPNGVVFARGAQVDAAGVLASTRDIKPADFMDGRLVLEGAGTGRIENHGRIAAAPGGYVAMVAAQIVNHGQVHAPGGEVRLAAADAVRIRLEGSSLAAFEVTRGTLDGLVANHGAISAEGGRVWLTAQALDALSRAVVNNTGVIEAHGVAERGGEIVLLGDMVRGETQVGGTLDASPLGQAPGGFVETSAARVLVAEGARISTSSAGRPGLWLIDPTDFVIANTGGDISATTLSANLAGGDVTIQSISGAGGTAGDVIVNSQVNWSANRLTLQAQNNIRINANLNGSANAQLALHYGLGALSTGNASDIVFTPGRFINLQAGTGSFETKQGSDGAVVSYTIINNVTDLQGMRLPVGNLNGNYVLGSDIDASATAGWNAGAGFLPIGTNGSYQFAGRFNGLGHTISGLTINRPIEWYVGLFGKVAAGASVSNFILDDAVITGAQYTGGVAGWNSGTLRDITVSDSLINGSISSVGGVVGYSDGALQRLTAGGSFDGGGGNRVGGIVGDLAGGSATGLQAVALVSNGSEIGGIVGRSAVALDGPLSYSFVNGNNWVGGVAGVMDANLSNASAYGDISGNANVGGLVGSAGPGTTISNSSASGAVSGLVMIGGLAGYITGASVTDSQAQGNVSSGTIGGNATAGGLVGSASSSSITRSTATGAVTAQYAERLGGLIGQADNVSVSSSSATGAVTGSNMAGGLIGMMFGGSVSGSYATGTVNGQSYAGGLVGQAWFQTIDNSHATGQVIGTSDVGGLIGESMGHISNSYASGAVSGTNRVGGLVGKMKVGGSVTTSQGRGVVTGTGEMAGGLVGLNEGDPVSLSSATGAVTGVDTVGGLIGAQMPGSTVTGSWASNTVLGSLNVGGLIGSNYAPLDGAPGGGNNSYTGSVTGLALGERVGGIVGVNRENVTVSNFSLGSGVTVTATDSTSVGGVVGENNGTVSNVTTLGSVSNTGHRTGGVVGWNTGTGTLSSSTARGAVSGASYTGGLVGLHDGAALGGLQAHGHVTSTGEYVGGLVGFSVSGISDSHATGNVTSTQYRIGGLVGRVEGALDNVSATGNVVGSHYVGGLAGVATAAVTNSSASGNVTGNHMAGGLIGWMLNGQFEGNSASGAVVGQDTSGGLLGRADNVTIDGLSNSRTGNMSGGNGTFIGGWVGALFGTSVLRNAVNTGTVTGGTGYGVGGLVGLNRGTIEDSSNRGAVSAPSATADRVGGVAGQNMGTVQRAFNTGAVTGGSTVGGLIGRNSGVVSQSFSLAAVTATGGTAGGLLGTHDGSVANSYATGAVAGGGNQVGGLVGQSNGGSIDTSYAAGAVSGVGASVGGFAGDVVGGTFTNNFFDRTSSGQAQDRGTGSAAATGKTTAQMMSLATFSGWSMANVGGAGLTWRVYEGDTRPLLMHWLAPLNVTGSGATVTSVYDGLTQTVPLTFTTGNDSARPGHVLGSARFTAAGPNVGTYTAQVGPYSDQFGWDISYTPGGQLQIQPRPLTASLVNVTKEYDGSTAVAYTPQQLVLTGFVANQGASAGGPNLPQTATLNAAGVLAASSAQVSLTGAEFTALAGTLLSNYTLPTVASGPAQVTPRPLQVVGQAESRVYDGTTNAQVSLTTTGAVGVDSVTVSGTGRYADANVGEGKGLVFSGLALSGAQASNYMLPNSVSGSGSILPRAITLNLVGPIVKTDDSTTQFTLLPAHYVIGNVVQGEGLSLAAVLGQFDSATPGPDKTVSISLSPSDYVAAPGTLLGNYTLRLGSVSADVGEIRAPAPTLATVPSLPNTASGSDQARLLSEGPAAPAQAAQQAGPANGPSVAGERWAPPRGLRLVGGGMRLPVGVVEVADPADPSQAR